jgi:asparagine synthase (glutamine-hydrolysing)
VRTPIRTFNVRFPDAGFDETRFARAAAAHCHTEHETLSLDEGGIPFDDVLRLLRHFDQPFADTSLIPTYRVCRLVRERGFICALSGDGGDEAFGGYSEFWKLPRLLRLARLPRPLHAAAATAGDRAGDWLPDVGRPLRRAASLALAAQGDPAVLIAGITNYLHEEEKEALVRAEAREGLGPAWRLVERFPDGARTPLETLTGRMTEYLFAVGLASDMLRKVDMMSMLTGLEIRVPLLDEEVVELGLRLPFPLKVTRNGGKVLLRALAERWLPPEVVRHRKQGFRVPLDRVLPPDVGTLLRDLLLAPDRRTRFLDERVVRRWLGLFEQSQRGAASKEVSRESLYQRVVFLVALEDWMRRNNLSW